MRCLGLFLCALILAGCSQESVNVAQAHSNDDPPAQAPSVSPKVSLPPTQITAPDKTTPVNPEPANPEPANPEPANPEPSKPEPAKPEVTPSEPKKVVPPDQEELSPAEVIARKLISHDSDDNLEVLNEALERWLTKKEALPERVGDLVNEQFLPMLPMAPEGKVFVIDAENRRVILIAEKK
ncbi:MAG: hypothetical protein QF406_10470 [Verrucomicrobiota bacterium]|jgi:hypothetical protein|nr:hypothetical protein [Verrucomicrobiota bacterium]